MAPNRHLIKFYKAKRRKFQKWQRTIQAVRLAEQQTDRREGIFSFIEILKKIPILGRKQRKYVLRHFKKYRIKTNTP